MSLVASAVVLALVSPAHADKNAAARAALDDPTGWVDVGTKDVDGLGTVRARHKEGDGIDCLEVGAPTAVSAATLRRVVLDIEANPRWSSATLTHSVVLARASGHLDYFQALDTPGPFADRYWFLRGTVVEGREGPGSWEFIWQKLDGPSTYPDRAPALVAQIDGGVEVGVNVGSWSVLDQGGVVTARFRTCTDVGGALPRWAGEAAAKAMLPNNLVDLITEGQRQGG